MKKLGISIALVTFLTIALSSCKTHERCPAYGKVDVNQQESAKVVAKP